MQQNKNISSAKVGMDRDRHISQTDQTSYTFALNANQEQETGEFLNLGNEPSNYLDVVFPSGYKVIGYRKHLPSERTFYILTNPTTGHSSIGYVEDIFVERRNHDPYTQDCPDCTKGKNKLETPLEDQVQTPPKQYVELINDDCLAVQSGLNLDINHPIKFLEIKTEKGQVNLYWNDYKNPPRWLNTTDTSYLFTEAVPCDDDVVTTCIDVDKLLQFPKYGSIQLIPKQTQTGGNLKLGSYEFYAAYCDAYGNNISDYSTPTNPVHLFDPNNNILSQTELDAYTNFAIKIKAKNLDSRHPYYKVVCVEKNNVTNTQSAFLEGVHPTTDDTIIYSSSGSTDDEYISVGNKRMLKRVSLDELKQTKLNIEKAVGTAAIQGKQFQWGLQSRKDLNLQPVVNLFGGLLQWQTSIAKEDLYKRAEATSNYKGYMRNEVQPFAIRFRFKDGGYTPNYPLVGRPSIAGERDEVPMENPNRASIEENVQDCSSTNRTEKWQFINTASQTGVCPAGENIPTQTIQEEVERTCDVGVVATIPTNEISIAVDGDFDGFTNYINDNFQSVTDCSDPNNTLYIPEIAPYLVDDCDNPNNGVDPYPADHCEPNFQGDCDVPTEPNSFQVLLGTIQNEEYTLVRKCIEDYQPSKPVQYCNSYQRNLTDGGYVIDYEWASLYMSDYCATFPNCDRPEGFECVAPIVIKREISSYNTECSYADDVFDNPPENQFGLGYILNYMGADTLGGLITTKNATYTDANFQPNVHEGALWFRIQKRGRDTILFEITKKATCEEEDAIPIGDELRYTFFANCNSDTPLPINILGNETGYPELDCDTYTPPIPGLMDLGDGFIIQLDTSTFPDVFYVAIDAPIVEESVPSVIPTSDCEDPFETCDCTTNVTKYRTAPPCGCFSIYTHDIEYAFAEVSWDSIDVEKTETYILDCTFEIPLIDDCDPIPYSYGEFSYWQSTEDYPDNEELYNSAVLRIMPSDLSAMSEDDQTRFEQFYTEGMLGENYSLKSDTNFVCQPIRHPKFPDNTIAPFMSTMDAAPFSDSLVYPIGVKIPGGMPEALLQVALQNGLITQRELNNIESYEVLKADNSVSKSVIANGLGYDMYKYKKKLNTHYYANFPHNDLGDDLYHFEDNNRDSLISHPYNSESNNRYSFLSPDIFLTKPAIPSEVILSGYQIGSSTGRFVDVEEHPKWTILGRKGRNTATLLGTLESALEVIAKTSEFITQGGAGHTWVVGGVTVGTNAIGGTISTAATIAFATASVASGFVQAGKYRYQWLQTFRDLGTPYNFAGYNVSHGYHNKFLPNTNFYNPNEDLVSYDHTNASGKNEYLRGLSVRKYMKNGRYVFRDKTTGENKMFVNNWSREKSVFLSMGKYHFIYDDIYTNYDNNIISENQGSRTTLGQNGCETDLDYERNVGSPYLSLKNYVPDQFGNIDSLKWLTTNHIQKINVSNTDCIETIFGGTVYISRFTWKRKLSHFTTTAFNLPDKLPFNYGDYDNIGSVRFFCNYEEDSTTNVLGVPFPDIDSNYNFDCVRGNRDFYVKPPSKLYLYNYGIADFLVESEINCNYRYGKSAPKDNFYPEVGGIVDWTQEKNVPISEQNSLYYNNTYSGDVSESPYKRLTATYDSALEERFVNMRNGVMWSEQDLDENSPVDPWLIYKPLNFFEFKSEHGKLIQLKEIEGGQVLARFEDRQLILNAVDNLTDRILPQTQQLGTGGIFSTRPKESNITDLGFAGTQHAEMLSTPYGHFTADAKRGKVFMTSGQGLEPISDFIGGKPSGMKNWFREHLPFKILNDFPELDIDNKFKGVGLAMGWDARHDRVFLTKKDYVVQDAGDAGECNGELVDTNLNNYQDIIDDYTTDGWNFEGIEDCQLKFVKDVVEITQTTDIHAVFDMSGSFSLQDQQDIENVLDSWFAEYQSNNPSYTGSLYKHNTSNEKWLGWLNSLVASEYGFDLTGRDILLISFCNESGGVLQYHDSSIGLTENSTYDIISNDQLNTFTTDYNSFVQRYNECNNFVGINYTIFTEGGVVNGSKKFVPHVLAALYATNITQTEFDTLSQNAYYTPQEWDNVNTMLVTNPNIYGDNGLQPLKDYGWKAVIDKDDLGADILTQEDFDNDLNSLLNIGGEQQTEEVAYEPLNTLTPPISGFKPVHWTVSYSPTTQNWVSYHSFTPDYYVSHNEHMQSGHNWDLPTESLWSHPWNNTSFQVYYGTKYPFILDVPVQNQNANKIWNNLQLDIESKRYQNEWDYSQHPEIGFNKAVVYNNTNNSGMLRLDQQKTFKQEATYPKTNTDGTQSILFSAEDEKHLFNYFYNRTNNEKNNIPQWLWDENRIHKTINPQAVSFRGKRLLERIRGEQVNIRLIQDKESRYKIILKDLTAEETLYQK